jgi:hypothetical protein
LDLKLRGQFKLFKRSVVSGPVDVGWWCPRWGDNKLCVAVSKERSMASELRVFEMQVGERLGNSRSGAEVPAMSCAVSRQARVSLPLTSFW